MSVGRTESPKGRLVLGVLAAVSLAAPPACSSGGKGGNSQAVKAARESYQKTILDASHAFSEKIGTAEVGALDAQLSSGTPATPVSMGDDKVKMKFNAENQALGRSVCAAFEQFKGRVGMKSATENDPEHARFLAAESVKSSIAAALLRAATTSPEKSEKLLAMLGVPEGGSAAPTYVASLKASGILDPQGTVTVSSPFSDSYETFYKWYFAAKVFEGIVVDLATPAVLEINKCIAPSS
jgi:hypothetical protein